MAEKQASWIQASSHPADTDRLVLEALLNPSGAPVSGAAYGVGTPAGDLLVTQNGSPNMSVNVAAGRAWIDGTESPTQGVYHVYNDAVKNLTISAAHATLARKDLIVAKIQDAQYSGATNAWSLVVVTGTPAGSPAEPAIPANAIVLALVDVAAAASSITNANITDRRRRACGLSGIAVCTSATRPAAPYAGQTVFETDTNGLKVWSGSAWENVGLLGAWPSWTPTLTQSGAVTATITEAKYTKVGRMVTVRCKLSVTGTGTAAQAVRVGGLPEVAASLTDIPIGSGFIYDSSAADTITGVPYLATTSALQIIGNRSAGSVLGTGAGFSAALASGDLVNLQATYEAVS